ncbi:MAG: hemolysin III family protein [Steroidobacteraceae bacterium]|jgi:hemolysin III|nr:hemolysin III family protein [Steroidobacteraceae bacterium]
MTAYRLQSRAEEIANSATHALALVLVVVGGPVLIVTALRDGTLTDVVAVSVFAAAMALMYFASATYHALKPGAAKHVFHVLDHAAIYLLIAGTYTPFTLSVLDGAWGWTLFGVVWTLAILGIALKLVAGFRWHKLSLAVYVGMGWIAIVAIKPLMEALPAAGLAWLLAGGLAYTAGVAFYVNKRLRYSHAVWHLFVLAGTACHYVAVLRYAL